MASSLPASRPVRSCRRLRPSLEALEARLVLDGGVPAGMSLGQANWFYQNTFAAPALVNAQWSGDVATGNAGTLGTDYLNAIVARINAYRWMAGLPGGVTANNATENVNAQQAALMMSANNQLSHDPPSSWVDYTVAGADGASHSDLALGASGTAAIDLYMTDPGSNNTLVGHRRWLLDPPTQTMGVGDVPVPFSFFSQNGPFSANAIYVIQPTASPEPSVTTVAWPPAGFVPAPLVPARWSLQTDLNADFSQATVSVTENGVPQQVEILSTNGGIGGQAVVWDMPNAPAPAAGQQVVYAVRIDNVLVNGQPQSFSYTTTSFDPSATTASQPVPAAVQFLQSGTGTATTSGSAVIEIARSMNAGQALTVTYATADGSAHAGTDYVPSSGTVTFAPGQYYAQVVVPLLPGANHAGRTFTLTLSSPSGGVLGAVSTDQVSIGVPSPGSGDPTPTPTPTSSPPASIVGVALQGRGGAVGTVTIFVSGALDPSTAKNLANYRLASAGRDGVAGTADDVPIALKSVVYNAATGRITLTVRGRLALRATSELAVSGLDDLSGTPIDGGSYTHVFNPRTPKPRRRGRA
ncbi:MAG: Calx-beta domain-containing protein [Isosphaeraceae bacterium]|nr:Calx-beta domain-containing protein [Isosphaeraceae bacterium]